MPKWRPSLIEIRIDTNSSILTTDPLPPRNQPPQVLNSWGTFPPVGLFEGTLGDIGSYHGCLGVPENDAIQHAHYCTFSFRPILPTRKDYELIIDQEPAGLLELFEAGDTFEALAGKSQFNHYVYYKLGTCFPIDCSPVDAQKLAKVLAKRAILLSGPVKCYSKFQDDYGHEQNEKSLKLSSQDLNDGVYIWKPHINRSQLVALFCLGALTAIVLLFTLADLIMNRLPKILANLNHSTASNDTARAIGYRIASEPSADYDELKLGSLTVMNHVIGSSDASQHHSTDIASNRCLIRMELDKRNQPESNGNADTDNNKKVLVEPNNAVPPAPPKPLLRQLVHDCSLITNTNDFFYISKQQAKSDILCMNGLRCITMSWIILAHTIQYNDWSAFARIYEIETHLKSLMNQPIFNASYLVDTFFLMSGLLTSYSVFRSKSRGNREHGPTQQPPNRPAAPPLPPPSAQFSAIQFSIKNYLIGRYLRLTPQILLVSLLFILLPLLSSTGGPHWDSMTGEYSEDCSNNWWINLLHIQAFYKPGEMCNFVCWWISIDMLYHTLAVAIILVVLRLGPRFVVLVCSALALINGLVQASRHYQMGLPPNLLSTIPQTGAMWAQMTLNYFWTPSAHLFPFVFGFQLGFLLARHKQAISSWFTKKRALAGWLVSMTLFACVSFGTHFWVIGRWRYTSEISTIWALGAQIVWSICVAWTIVACQFGFGGFINRMLSCKLFIVLGKASYLVYLSHFLVLLTFFGSQNLLLEPTRIMIIYIILGNICLSMAFGSFLCVAFEMPWLKLQKRIMRLIEG
jgi:peptidoglycan/LPS O-acetylase OafA/YrhL